MTVDATQNEQFVRCLTEYQRRLYTYILAMLGDPNAADDVFQDTNVAIWRKAAEYAEGTKLRAWTSRIAYYEVLAYRKRQPRGPARVRQSAAGEHH